MDTDRDIEDFLAADSFAVVGASTSRAKYGNRVLRLLQKYGRDVTPINPNAPEVEGLRSYASLADLPSVPTAISIITPPEVTEVVVQEAIRLGIRLIWMQPGAESPDSVRHCRDAGVQLIHGGPCILVVMPLSS